MLQAHNPHIAHNAHNATTAAEDVSSLYADGELYDLFMAGQNHDAEVAFYASAAATPGARILELGCGTGRLSVPLCAAGFDVTALDGSEAMLDTARAKATRYGAQLRFVRQDIREFQLDSRFDVVMLPHNTMAHLLTLEDIVACLACVHRHLADGGVFVIDMSQPNRGQFCADEFPPQLIINLETSSGKLLQVRESALYDAATQIHDRRWHVESPTAPARQLRFQTRVLFPMELDALLRLCGFAIGAKYGNFERAPYCSRAERQLLVCQQVAGHAESQ